MSPAAKKTRSIGKLRCTHEMQDKPQVLPKMRDWTPTTGLDGGSDNRRWESTQTEQNRNRKTDRSVQHMRTVISMNKRQKTNKGSSPRAFFTLLFFKQSWRTFWEKNIGAERTTAVKKKYYFWPNIDDNNKLTLQCRKTRKRCHAKAVLTLWNSVYSGERKNRGYQTMALQVRRLQTNRYQQWGTSAV